MSLFRQLTVGEAVTTFDAGQMVIIHSRDNKVLGTCSRETVAMLPGDLVVANTYDWCTIFGIGHVYVDKVVGE